MGVQVGGNVEAMLLSVDLALGRVELSIRRTLPDPKLASVGEPATEEAEVEEQDLAGELGNMSQVMEPENCRTLCLSSAGSRFSGS